MQLDRQKKPLKRFVLSRSFSIETDFATRRAGILLKKDACLNDVYQQKFLDPLLPAERGDKYFGCRRCGLLCPSLGRRSL